MLISSRSLPALLLEEEEPLGLPSMPEGGGSALLLSPVAGGAGESLQEDMVEEPNVLFGFLKLLPVV